MKTTNSSFAVVLGDSHCATSLEQAGGKGASLARLTQAGLPVPGGFIVTTEAYRRFVEENELSGPIRDALSAVGSQVSPTELEAVSAAIQAAFARAAVPAKVAAAIDAAYAALAASPNGDVAVAVRSSATAEDLPELSFAGQQESYLNVRGTGDVRSAVQRCWASLWTARAIDYRLRHDVPQDAVALAVVVQRLIPGEVAGIMFTANPMNGARDEMVINAAWGLGEAIVSGEVSPDTIVVAKATGAIKRYEIADKAAMTFAGSSLTETRAVEPSKRHERTLDEARVRDLVALGRRIEELNEMPQDIEWCWTGDGFAILQARPITTLSDAHPLPEVPTPGIWAVPNPKARYLRNNIVELIPDPMSPLFATLGRQAINTSMNRLMASFFGKSDLMPEELIVEIEGYAYYNGDLSTKAILQILLGAFGIAKRMFTGVEARARDAYGIYRSTVARYQATAASDASPRTSIAHLDAAAEIMETAIDYYGALVGGLIPAAWISEGLFTTFYNTLVKRRTDPRAEVFLLGFDSLPIRGEKALYDLAQWVTGEEALAAALIETPTAELVGLCTTQKPIVSVEGRRLPTVPPEAWDTWIARFRAYLETYGATIYDLDFAKPTSAEAPTPILEALKLYLRGGGTDPHARQEAATEAREHAVSETTARLRGLRRRWFTKLLARAQKYAPQREDGLATLGLGYPPIRHHLLAVGRRLAEVEALKAAEDVFWLPESDVRHAAVRLDRGERIEPLSEEAARQRALWEARRRLTPPMGLPLPPRWMRTLFPKLNAPNDAQEAGAGVIQGTACSPGTVTATARVLHGPEDFGTLRPGEVLVAGITTPAWTPLFAMAGAVVTDVGGPLSHGSIVAREYGIPAVLGTGDATRRLKSGDRVRVDGARGTVEVMS